MRAAGLEACVLVGWGDFWICYVRVEEAERSPEYRGQGEMGEAGRRWCWGIGCGKKVDRVEVVLFWWAGLL